MSRPVVWFRLWRGKVWHLRDAIAAAAVCGVSEPDDSEATAQTPPTRARICEACTRAARELYLVAMEASTGDPRLAHVHGYDVEVVEDDEDPGVPPGAGDGQGFLDG